QRPAAWRDDHGDRPGQRSRSRGPRSAPARTAAAARPGTPTLDRRPAPAKAAPRIWTALESPSRTRAAARRTLPPARIDPRLARRITTNADTRTRRLAANHSTPAATRRRCLAQSPRLY